MDVITEMQTSRGAHCTMTGSRTMQTLEDVRHAMPEQSSSRSNGRKITIGTQPNAPLETEADTSGEVTAMEIESPGEKKFGKAFATDSEACSEPQFAIGAAKVGRPRPLGIKDFPETKFGDDSAKVTESPPWAKFGETSTNDNKSHSGIEIGEASIMEIESPPEIGFREASTIEIDPPLVPEFGEASRKENYPPVELEFGEASTKENDTPFVPEFGGTSAMEIEAPPVRISSPLTISVDPKDNCLEKAEEKANGEYPNSQTVLEGLEGIFREEEKKKEKEEEEEEEEAKEEPLSQSLPDSDLIRDNDCKEVVGETSSSKVVESKLRLTDGGSLPVLEPKLAPKKESSSRSLDSSLPPKKQSSSRSLDSKLSPSMVRRRNRVSVTVLERMQQDPLLAEHFAQLETPTTETISEFSAHGFEPRRSLKSTSRLKCTTDSVGLKYVNQYIVIKVLGRGTFGKVKLCLNTMDCKLYAVKILHRKWVARRSIGGTRDDVGKGALREIAIMKKLNHPNVVALIEVIDDPSNRKLYLVLEYVEGGPIMANDLWHPIPEEKARKYFRDMLQGLDYLHFNKIVHRDLKPGNLLQTMDGRIKISDFGVSHMLDHESDSIHGTAGTPAFLAPEICSGGEGQGRAADIWALGVCLYVMVYGEIPFPAETVVDMYKCIIEKKSLILKKDPESRLSLASIMQHDWVSSQGTEPLVPFKLQKSRVSSTMAVSEAEVKAAINVKHFGLPALSNVDPVEKHFEPGEYIMRQGEEGQEMYLINSGECEVLVESRSLTQPSRGRMEYAIAERGPGQYIGEMALSRDATKKPPKRTASIRAKTHVVTLVVSRDQVMEALSKNSEAAKSIADTIAERDREMRRKMKALELRLPSFRPASFKHVNEQERPKEQAVLEHPMPTTSHESDEHVRKRASICLGCRII